jgi:hypothetical protein
MQMMVDLLLTIWCLAHRYLDGQSAYNDGRGIRFVVTWTPLPLARKPGQKRRKNAKSTSQNVVVYVHESATLHTCLTNIFESLNPILDLIYHWRGPIGAWKIETEMFTTHATIPRTSFKDIKLQTQLIYKDLLEQVILKGSPEIKLVIVETKVCNLKLLAFRYKLALL